jgi:hypothetical protein
MMVGLPSYCRSLAGTDHRIIGRNVGKHCIEIDSYGISVGGDRAINPNCEIERCTAAERKGVPHPGQSADAVVQRGRKFHFQRFAGWWLDCGLA